MKNTDCTGSNNAVVAATTSLSSSQLQLSLPSTSLSSSSLNVAGTASSSSALKGASAVEDCGLACWQRGGGSVRDLHSSSDTDDCDLDLGVGRLVIDLEADPDARARCPSSAEMKSSSGQQQQQKLIGGSSSGTLPGIHGTTTTPVGSISAMETNLHLGRGVKTLPASENATKPSHKSLTKSIGSNSSFMPMTTALGDLADKGIKMRIKCNQSGPNSASSGSTMKHEILPYHTPFIPSSSSSENILTSTADSPCLLVTKTSNERSSYGSGSLTSRSNCSRSSHKKERHSTKDRSKAANPSRPFGEDVVLANAAHSSPSSIQMSCSSAKESLDVVVKMDLASSDSDGAKASTSSHDPYEFNMKTEDIVGLPVKKIKLEKCDVASSPLVDHSLPELELKDAEVDACHIGVITEPECLGPCEPGTSVTLEGIVWNETENGLLVVNVTWRGKTYVGTLMDSTKHHWAPPRFSGDSPTSDFETRTPKGRGKRGRTCAVAQRNEGNGSDRKLRSNRSNKPSATVAAPSPVRNDASSLKRSRTETASSDGSRGSKCSRSDSRTSDLGNGTVGACGELAYGGLIECPEENCSKKYRNLNGLRYHQTRVHRSTCTSLPKDLNDVQTGKYINDDFVENSVAEAERFVWKTKPTSAECSNSKRTAQNTNKLMENETKFLEFQNSLEEMESQGRPTVNGISTKEEGMKERETGHGKTSFEAEPKAEESPEPVCTNALSDESNEHGKGTSVVTPGKGTNSFAPINADDSKKLGTNNHPLVTLTPVLVPARVMDDSTSSAVYQMSSASTGSLGAVATEPLVLPAASLPPGNTSSEDAKSQSSNAQSRSDGDRGKKSKSEKLERSKVKLPGGSMPRPVVPPVSASSSVGMTKPALLSQGPPMTLQTGPAQQLKPIQPKPLLSTEQAHLNLVTLTDKSKKRKREKEKLKEQPLLPIGTKPVATNKPGFGSENPETAQHPSQNAAVLVPSATSLTDYAEPASSQAVPTAAAPVSSSSTSSESFGQMQLSTSDSCHLTSQPDLVPVTARCSPALGALPRFPMHPTASEQLVPAQTAPTARSSDSSNTANQSNIQMTLPPPSPVSQQRLHLPVENMNLRPVVVSLHSPLSAMKAVPSSVIKNTSGFEIGSNCDLPSEPKPQPVADPDLPNQPLLTERKLPILPSSSDFIMKPNESSSKPAPHDGLHPTSGTNPPLNSPCKKPKNTSAKHADGGSNLTDFGNPHSPAYSDISDANDSAPMLDAPMLEKEAQAAAAEEEEVIGSKVSPSHPQDSYVYSPFYGQPPYLTPAVSSSDIPDCGSVLKPSLSKPPLEKHQTLDKVKTEGGSEKRLAADSVPLRSRPAAEMPLKFPVDQQLREQPLRDDKDTREKGSRVLPAPVPSRTDVHKSQQQQQQQQQQHKMFSGEAMLPQQAAMMQHVIMPPFAIGAQFGYYSQEYSSEMQRIFQLQQQQQQEARRHDQPSISKLQPESAGDHSKTRQTGKVPADGKPLPTPPSLIPDRNRHDLKDDADRSREKQLENRKLSKDGIEVKNLTDVGGTKPEGGYDMKTLVDRPDLQRYCIQPHFLEQQQQRLNEHQSHKSMMESGVGGCKPSAVVAPQARDKNTSSMAGIVGNTPLLHGLKQSSREDAQGRGHEGHRSHRDSQKNPSMTPPQQHTMLHKSSAGTSRDSSAGRVQKDTGDRGNAKEDSGPSGSRGVISKVKDEAPMTSLPVSMPTGIPAPYAPYYGHYLPPTPYGGAMPFDPTHAPLYPGMMGYAPAPYIHPAQMLSPALAMASADVKPCDILAPSQQPAFFSNEGQTHKIHELKEVAKMQQGADGSQPSPGNRDPSRPKSSGGSHSLGKDSEHSSPPTQRHVHTHHHMHVVGLPYRFVGDAAIIASQQAAAATDATQIPRPFLK